MKRIKGVVLVVFGMLGLAVGASGQEYGQKIGSLNVAVEGEKSKDFVFKDDDVEITISKISASKVDFNIKNITNEGIDFLWSDSYYILSGRSTPFLNSGNAVELITGVATKEINSTSPKIKIAPRTYAIIKASAQETNLFDFNFANKFFKDTGDVPTNTAVLALIINGEVIEKKIKFQMYTSRIIKSLEKRN